MEKFELRELTVFEAERTVGGSPLSEKIFWVLGKMFSTPAAMAVNGAAGHEVMGSK